jgi:hypothetical protein
MKCFFIAYPVTGDQKTKDDSVQDEIALKELLRASRPGAAHLFHHYLYFPPEVASAQAANDLRRIGFTAEQQLSAYDENWLVLASHAMVPTTEAVEFVREQMEALATRFGGEYDGWEAEVLP